MEKVLTISIAAYNAAGDLPRCLESMLQTEVADKLEISTSQIKQDLYETK